MKPQFVWSSSRKTLLQAPAFHTCALALLLMGTALPVSAASGRWTANSDGNWSDTSKWASGIVADGADSIADFATVDITTNRYVTLDAPRTVGFVKFGDTTGTATNWYLLGPGVLTLATNSGIGTMNSSNGTVVIAAPIAATEGVRFTGNEILLTNANSYSGGTYHGATRLAFANPNAFGSGTFYFGTATGEAQHWFNAVSSTPGPITLNNNFELRSIRCIIGNQNVAGLANQPQIWNGNVMLNMGTANVRDIFCQQALTINGIISGGSTYGLNLVSGTLTISNPNNDFTGNINFTGGSTLGVNADSTLGYFANRLNFNAAATLRIDAPFTMPNTRGLNGIGIQLSANATIDCLTNDLQIDTVIVGGGALTKTGSGRLTLTGQNTFTGALNLTQGSITLSGFGALATSSGLTVPTNSVFEVLDSASIPNMGSFTVNDGGTLRFRDFALLSSASSYTLNGGAMDLSALLNPFTLGTGQALNGSGVVTGSVVAGSGAQVLIGTLGTPATLSITKDLTLNGQSLTFDLRNDTTEGSGTNDLLVVGDNLVISGTEKIFLNYLDGALAPGVYKIITFGTSKTGNFSLGTTYPNVTLDNSGPGYVGIVVSAPSIANDLIWKGDGTANIWDLNTTANWVTNFANAAITYSDPSRVLFNDAGSNSPAINLTAIVMPTSVTFDLNEKAYTLSGPGKISGTASLSVTGTNKAIVATDNDYAGLTSIGTNATLQLGNGGATGSTGPNTISMVGGATLIANRSDELTLPRVTRSSVGAGGAANPILVQNGPGTTTLAGPGDNAFLGATINNGTLLLGKASSGSVHALGGPTVINSGGTLRLGGTGNDQIVNGASFTLAGGTFELGGVAETISLSSGYGRITDTFGGGTLTGGGAPGLIVTNGVLTVDGGTVTLSGNPGLRINSTLEIAGGTVTVSGANNTANGVAGGGTLRMTGGTHNAGFYYSIGANSPGPSITSTGLFSGGTFINTGEMLNGFNKPAQITVSDNAVLDLNFYSYGDNPSSHYLNGGTIRARQFNRRNPAIGNVMYFNGVNVVAKAPAVPTFMGAMDHAYISTNGLFLDTANLAVTIATGLEHDPALGPALDGGLTKLGLGTLTLTGINSFTGPITNQGGLLQFTTLGGRTAATFVADNATNRIKVALKGTSVTNQSLTLGSSGFGTQGLEFDLGTLGLPTAPPLTIAGTLASAGGVSVGIIAPLVPPGTVSLVKYGTFDPAQFASWSISQIPYVDLSLANNTANKTIDLVVQPGNYPLWTAALNNQWDFGTVNWKMLLTSTPTNYFESMPPGPPVAFDDSAANRTVDIVQTVSPAFITMSNNLDYIFQGAAGIAGSGALLKSGNGRLTFNNAPGANTYSGITLVNGGSLAAAVENALSTASDITLTGSALDIGNNNQAIGNLTLNDSPIIGTATFTGNGGALNINSSNNLTLANSLAGTIQFGKGGTGTLSITNANPYRGATLVNAGTLRLTHGDALGAGGFDGGTWTLMTPGGAILFDGALTVGEHFHIIGHGPNGLGAMVATNGDTTMGVGGAHTALDAESTIYVAANATLTNLAQFYGGARLVKAGPGLLYGSIMLNNATVNEGTLIASGQLGNNNQNDISVLVNTGGTLGGVGPVTPPATVQAGGTIAPGNLTTGNLTFNILTNAGVLAMEIAKSGTTLANDRITVTSSFVHTGSIVVNNLGPDPLAAGDSFQLFAVPNYSTIVGTATLPALPPSLVWSNNLAINGTISVHSSGPTTPAEIAWSYTSGNLTLYWPAEYTGWRLLVQTNNLNLGVSTVPTDWQEVPGSTAVNQVVIPVTSGKPAEYYRLAQP